jgi:hypothetical protein
MGDEKKRVLVLELFAEDVQTGLDEALSEKRQEVVRFVESLWDKYRLTFNSLARSRSDVATKLDIALDQLGYMR